MWEARTDPVVVVHFLLRITHEKIKIIITLLGGNSIKYLFPVFVQKNDIRVAYCFFCVYNVLYISNAYNVLYDAMRICVFECLALVSLATYSSMHFCIFGMDTIRALAR